MAVTKEFINFHKKASIISKQRRPTQAEYYYSA